MSDELDKMIRQYGDELGRAQRREPARRAFPLRRVAIVGSLAGLARGVAVAALPGSGPGRSTAYALKQAKAVLSTDNAIIHVVSTATMTDGEKVSVETWVGPDGHRAVFDDDGDGVKDQLAFRWNPQESSTDGKLRVRTDQYDRASNTHSFYLARLDRDSAVFVVNDPTLNMRSLLASGRVEDAGIVDVHGREARKLLLRTAPTPPKQTGSNSGVASTTGSVTEYYVDPDTFAPVRVRSSVGDPADHEWSISDVLTFERLPLTAQNRQLLRIKVPADAETEDETKTVGDLLSRR